MNILTTYTLKYLRLNKKRTAVTILGVILSSALICGVILLGVSFQKVMVDHEIFMSGNWHAQFHAVRVRADRSRRPRHRRWPPVQARTSPSRPPPATTSPACSSTARLRP